MQLVTEPAAGDGAIAVHSDILGPLMLSSEQLWQFPAGLYGFPDSRSFALLPTGREGVFWLQSTTHSALAFLLVDPFVFFPGYTVDLSGADLVRIGTTEASDVVVLSIVTLPGDRAKPWSANLQGPIVLNARDRHGYQCVLPNDAYGVKEEFRLEPTAAA